jgi:hypothetical protein
MNFYGRPARRHHPAGVKYGVVHQHPPMRARVSSIPGRSCTSAIGHCATISCWGRGLHVGSTMQHFAAAHIGDELTAHAVVTANYERKGHRFVELDVLVYAEQKAVTARIGHIAIYRPRQLANAA